MEGWIKRTKEQGNTCARWVCILKLKQTFFQTAVAAGKLCLHHEKPDKGMVSVINGSRPAPDLSLSLKTLAQIFSILNCNGTIFQAAQDFLWSPLSCSHPDIRKSGRGYSGLHQHFFSYSSLDLSWNRWSFWCENVLLQALDGKANTSISFFF